MLKKTCKLIGILLLLVFSFVYTEKVFTTAKDNNSVMKEVVKYKNSYDIKPKEPIIKKDELILGYSGLIVDKEATYKNMDDKFDKDKIVYKDKFPNTTITKNYNYYIKQGNVTSKSVAIIFKVKNENNLNSFLDNINKLDIKINFFIDASWLSDNIEKAFDMTNMGYDIYNLGYDGKYDKKSINKSNNLIESITLKDSKYCLNEDKNDYEKEVCKKKKMLTILPTMVNPSILELRQNLVKGAIISYDLDTFDNSKINIILKTITSRGYMVKALNDVINEKRY